MSVRQAVTLAIDDGRAFLPVFSGELTMLSRGLDSIQLVKIQRSFVTLVLEVRHPTAQVMVDGEDAVVHRVADVLQVRISVDRDIEFHRISILAGLGCALVLDIEVEHHYLWATAAGAVAAPKWSVDRFKTELSKSREYFEPAQTYLSMPEDSYQDINAGEPEHVYEVLPQVISRLEQLLVYTPPAVIAQDFHRLHPGEIDKNAILTAIKSQRDRLEIQPQGPISLAGKQYGTSLTLRSQRASSSPYVDEVANLISWCASTLKGTGAYVGAFDMLRNLLIEVETLYRVRDLGGSFEVSLLSREMRSDFGRRLQSQLNVLVAIIRRIASKSAIDSGLLFLRSMPRDFDVFERSAYSACVKALALPGANTASADKPISVIDGNSSLLESVLDVRLKSWRRHSLQPSNFRPDVVAVIGDATVVIDAKFRISTSKNQPVSPEAVKEVQAYLDDFGLRAAVIITPKISGSGGSPAVIAGERRRIFAVEMQDSDDPNMLLTLSQVLREAATYN